MFPRHNHYWDILKNQKQQFPVDLESKVIRKKRIKTNNETIFTAQNAAINSNIVIGEIAKTVISMAELIK
jgi:hypothetical protein